MLTILCAFPVLNWRRLVWRLWLCFHSTEEMSEITYSRWQQRGPPNESKWVMRTRCTYRLRTVLPRLLSQNSCRVEQIPHQPKHSPVGPSLLGERTRENGDFPSYSTCFRWRYIETKYLGGWMTHPGVVWGLFVESSLGGATPLVSPPKDLSRAVVAF